MRQHPRLPLLFVMIGLSIVGCGGGKDVKREPVFKIHGKVLYKGQPVADADVVFFCEAKNRGAFGKTNSKGEFKLTTFKPNDGAVAGKHLVTVVKAESTDTTKEAALEDPAYNPDAVAKQVPAKPLKNAIPAKYASPKTSDLFWVVNDDGKNDEAELELTD